MTEKTLKELRQENGCGESCQGCDFHSYCDDCEKSICAAYDMDYRNIDETGETLCGLCNALRIHAKRLSSIPHSSKDKGILEAII
jgi:hypothetical protein